MARNALDVSTDNATMRLIKLAQAYQLSGELPSDSGRKLVQYAKSVRLFAEAREPRAADAMTAQILAMVPDGDAEVAEVRSAILRAVGAVRRALGFAERVEAEQDVKFRAVA